MEILNLIGNQALIHETAELFCQIFGEKPWFDDFVTDEIVAVMEIQFAYPSAIAFAVIEGGDVVGFIWLYEFFETDLSEGTRFSPQLRFLFQENKRVFYLQEIGVNKEYRRQGIGESLGRKAIEKAREAGSDILLLSTHCKAVPARSLFAKLGFENSGIVRPPKELSRTYWILKF